jgi:hypothetical protein
MNLEDIITLYEITQTQKEKHCMILHVESKYVKYIEIKRTVVTEGREEGDTVRYWPKDTKLQLQRMSMSGDTT